MSCQEYDWKAYAFGELTAADRREADAHRAACLGCQAELDHVRLTIGALGAMHEEEVPRRIAFVSDKVFEPKWWHMFLRPSFTAALLIAAAIVAHGFIARPAVNDAEIQDRINQAVAASEQRNADAVKNVDTRLTDFYVKATGIVRQ